MIVRNSSEGWHIIYQAAHGILAGKLANELLVKLRPLRWMETLTAIIEHDDQQLNFEEKSYLNNLGMPVDFTEDHQTEDQVLERARRVLNKAAHKSKWTAMLVSLHIDFLYNRKEYPGEKLKDFFASQEKVRKEYYAYYNIQETEAGEAYDVLRFCDRCSLILCKDEIPAFGRSIEINKTINKKEYMLRQNKDRSITVEPWCFEKKEFDISVEEQLLQKASFKDDAEFHESLLQAETITRSWKFKKG